MADSYGNAPASARGYLQGTIDPNSSLYQALSGGSPSPGQQPSAPSPAGSPAVGDGSQPAIPDGSMFQALQQPQQVATGPSPSPSPDPSKVKDFLKGFRGVS